jgi:membrane-bound lytic murein transglycosylase B
VANKSIIEVEVKAGAFNKFVAAFEKYRANLESMPGQWGNIEGAQNKTTVAATKQLKALEEQDKLVSGLVAAQIKLAAAGEKTARTFGDTARQTGRIAKDVAGITLGLAKWAALGAIGAAAGSLFGMNTLATSASDLRRKSQGLGVSGGDLRAARTNFSRYADVDSTLGNIADAQSDVSKRWIFKSLGVNDKGGDAAQLLPQVLRGVVAAFKQTGGTQQGYAARGLDKVVDFETARRLAGLKGDELQQAIAKYQADRKLLDVTDELLKKWQNLDVQLTRSDQQIEGAFLKGLQGLSPVIEKLSNSFAAAVETFMSNPKLGEWLTVFGNKLESLAKYLASDEFEKDVKNFMAALDFMAKKLESVAKFLGLIDDRTDKQKKNDADVANWWATPGAGSITKSNATMGAGTPASPEAAKFLSKLESSKGLPKGLLDAVWQAESGRGTNMKSGAGAEGHFQFMPSTAKQYNVANPYDFNQSATGASQMYADLLKKYHGDVSKALAAYNWGPGNVDESVAQYRQNWKSKLPAETSNYVAKIQNKMSEKSGAATGGGMMKIKIENNTGGSAIVQSSQLAH